MIRVENSLNSVNLVDRLLNLIEHFADHFVFKQHVTLSETMLFGAVICRAVWFSLFGVQIGIDTVGNDLPFVIIFWTAALVHILSFFSKSLKLRILVMGIYGFMWVFVAGLVSFTSFGSPSVPTFAIFGLSSIFIAVRLMGDKKNDEI